MYQAIIVKLTNVRPHPNADKLKLATVQGYQVVVGLDSEEGQIGIFFPCEGQLSPAYAEANDLVGYKDENGKRKGGFFGKNRRVRSQRFRGEQSDGYFAPLDSLNFVGVFTGLKLGDLLHQLGGIDLCNKYVTPETARQIAGQGRQRRQNEHFAKHFTTGHLKRETFKLQVGDLITITEKLHGTSGRFGYVLDNVPQKRTLIDKLWGRTRTKRQYRHLLGTRNVILADRTVTGYYGKEEFRWNTVQDLFDNLHKGEMLFFELVGYSDTGSIMATHSSDKLPEIKKKYGKVIEYNYGCPQGTCRLFVYRITRTNEDGDVIELSWNQVQKRCDELGIQTVPQLLPQFILAPGHDLGQITDGLLEYPTTIGGNHPREGVVVRADSKQGMVCLKSKSFSFGVMEGYLKDDESYVDMEEVS